MLEFDETGARYYETGVSKGVLFPIDDTPGVPWNGLVSVNLDPQGGESEQYYFDGVKYMDRVLAEQFQATIQAINTPLEFDKCEGNREYAPGVMTSFNKRDKFHMAWRTEIGNDTGQSVGYKIHIAYNNLVQPAGREYQTISDTTSMGVRSFVITATPACARMSYFWFDSRYWDLSLLEAELYSGNLPRCWELKNYVAPAGGGGTPDDPDLGCLNLFEDLEDYAPGQTITEFIEGDTWLKDFWGTINNGLDITVLPAEGDFAANDSAASVVGTGNVLADDDDLTYVDSADGDLGYTIGLPPLVGYVPGCLFELHIRASIDGGVNPDDPDNLDADMQVHISTDAGGDTTIGGFSDGTDEGMGFALRAVDGSIQDYVVPLFMDAWVDSTIDDVVDALKVGAYLNVVGAANNNPETTPVEVRVYEASVYMLDKTDPGKYLRPTDVGSNATLRLEMFESGSSGPFDMVAHSAYVDFEVRWSSKIATDGHYVLANWNAVGSSSARPGYLVIGIVDGGPVVRWFANDWDGVSDSGALAEADVVPSNWYRAQIDWSNRSVTVRVWDRDIPNDFIMEYTASLTSPPKAYVEFGGGFLQ